MKLNENNITAYKTNINKIKNKKGSDFMKLKENTADYGKKTPYYGIQGVTRKITGRGFDDILLYKGKKFNITDLEEAIMNEEDIKTQKEYVEFIQQNPEVVYMYLDFLDEEGLYAISPVDDTLDVSDKEFEAGV